MALWFVRKYCAFLLRKKCIKQLHRFKIIYFFLKLLVHLFLHNKEQNKDGWRQHKEMLHLLFASTFLLWLFFFFQFCWKLWFAIDTEAFCVFLFFFFSWWFYPVAVSIFLKYCDIVLIDYPLLTVMYLIDD